MPNITKRFVESLPPHPQKLIQYWDTALKGFGAIVLPSKRRTYCIQYRIQKEEAVFLTAHHNSLGAY